MRKIMLLVLVFALTSCYAMRPEMYESRTAYYKAQSDIYTAKAEIDSMPLVSFTTPAGDLITVANPIPTPMPVIQQERNGWVDVWKTTVNSTPLAILAGGWSARELLKNVGGDVNINGDGNTASPISNSYNSEATDIATATDDGILDQHADSSDQSSVDNSDDSDNSDNRSDYGNQTADPTVVTQPAAVIVDPVIVPAPAPVIVDPVIVNPVTVNPEIVNPVIIND